ncbi:hypothetical protein OH809_41875 [Streptomyces sp. NBC_00873]|uniref:hypothetical protein n=1 Tax=unclassified Streptomyces TaxID=2593676 RepID=UPI00386D293F|nr:hypothetical protein OH809_01835 [Streptomyces sp. NBC_00873]WSY96646.1 hypothetical protein OH809_41875 [Streptomyces sp. NBC_00873]WTA41580.1 hypothetical protein OH821_01830 [Streptomyces sp. NBC_00842]WTA48316.1 hypothetical protein OH821_41980 [Streptomyces sp. NBC_00842]
MKTRTVAVTAAAVGAAVIATTGITYASAAGSTQAAPSVQQAAPAVQQAAPDAAPLGGEGGNGGGGKGNEGGGYGGGERGGNERGGHERRGHREEGRIFINERSYSARGEEGCITVVSGLGAKSFNVRNDSRRTVEFFRGATCDNGSPVATVGPWSTSNGVFTRKHIRGGVFVRNGVVGSFRVVRDHFDRFDRDDRGGGDDREW